jgi:dihydroorotate dehydrogenase
MTKKVVHFVRFRAPLPIIGVGGIHSAEDALEKKQGRA